MGSRLRMSLISSMNTSRKRVCPLQIAHALLCSLDPLCPPYLQTMATLMVVEFCRGKLIENEARHWTEDVTDLFTGGDLLFCGGCCGQHIASSTCNGHLLTEGDGKPLQVSSGNTINPSPGSGCDTWIDCFVEQCQVRLYIHVLYTIASQTRPVCISSVYSCFMYTNIKLLVMWLPIKNKGTSAKDRQTQTDSAVMARWIRRLKAIS